MISKLQVVIFFLLALCNSVYAQKEINFKHLTPTEGLSQSNVTCILQDSQGFMWFGTQDGLNRYDGYKFSIYRNNKKDSTSLSGNYVVALMEDKDKNLWIGTQGGGVSKFDRKKNNFIHYKANKNNTNSICSDKIKTLYQDKTGAIWIGTYDNGITIFNPKSNSYTHYKSNSNDPNTLSNNFVSCFFEDSKGNFWVGTYYGGLNKYDKKTNRFERISLLGGDTGLNGNKVSQILEDSKGTLWIAMDDGGLSKYNHRSKTFTHYIHDINNKNGIILNEVTALSEDKDGNLWIGTRNGGIDIMDRKGNFHHNQHNDLNAKSLNNNSIYSIFRDNTGNMWVGTYAGGINLYLGMKEKFIHYKPEIGNTNSLSHKEILSIIEDKRGNVWIGTDGGGLNKFNKKNKSFTHYKPDVANPYSITDGVIMSLVEDSNNAIWLSTLSTGLNVLQKDSDKFIHYRSNRMGKAGIGVNWNAATSLLTDYQGNIWIGTWGQGLNMYDKSADSVYQYSLEWNTPVSEKTINSNVIFSLYEDKEHNIWIGTEADGASMLDRKSGKFTHFAHDENNPKSISGGQVNAIHEDSKGRMWFATNGGLNLYDKESKTFIAYKVKDGLPNDVIQGILEDNHGNLWLSTNKGIAQFNPESKNFRNYDVSDGLQGNEFKRHSCFKSSTGEMYFGGPNGLNSFHPDSIQDNPKVPAVVITDFQIFNQPVSIGQKGSFLQNHISETKEITLSYKESVLTFEFASLNFVLPEKNQYAYKLVGFDNDWNYVGDQRRATYTNLNPGEYTFMVKASNNDGVWNNEGASIRLTITPPFWATWWFRLLTATVIIGSVLTYYRGRMNAIKAQKAKLELQVKDRTADLMLANQDLQNKQEEISQQLEQIEEQRDHLAKISKEIMSSIRYAYSIQQAILPTHKNLKATLDDYFILYRPKDIVSGDFYWHTHLLKEELKGEETDVTFIAAIDCTGHGVPGAFMSIIGNTLLNEIVNIKHILDTAQILEHLDIGIKNVVSKSEGVNTASMDVCLVRIQRGEGGQVKIQYTGAKRNLVYIREGSDTIEILESDRRSIGGIAKNIKPFTTQELILNKGARLYLYTDGYVDQNNPDRVKLGTPKLNEIINEAMHHPLEMQKQIFENSLDDHQQEAEQRDDITLLGVKL